MKRLPSPLPGHINKRFKQDRPVFYREVIIRNDNDPYVYINTNEEYVKLGNYVYKTKKYHDIIQNIDSNAYIGLNMTQYNDVYDYIVNNKIMASTFDPDDYDNQVYSVNSISVNLKSKSNTNIFTSKNKLTQHIIEILSGHIVGLEQTFSTTYKNTDINITIKKIDNLSIGEISDDTEIEYKQFDSSIVISNICKILPCKYFRVRVDKCIEIESDESNLPLIIDQKQISNYIKNAFNDKFADGDSKVYRSKNFEFAFTINVIDTNNSKYKNTYMIDTDDDSDLRIESKSSNIIVTNKTKTAEKIRFSILSASFQNYKMSDYILNVEDIVSYVRENIYVLTLGQKFKYRIKNKDYILKVISIKPGPNTNVKYEINEHTKISFDTKTKSNFTLVSNRDPISIKELTFKLKKNNSSCGIFSFLMNEDSKKIIFDTKKMEKNIRNTFPKRTTIKQQMKITNDSNECTAVVRKVIFSDGSIQEKNSKQKYCTYGLITKDTEIKFETSRKNKSFILNNTQKNNVLKNPIDELEKHVGGITDEIKIVVRNICLSRGKLRSEFEARGLKSTKGIILHGPPGTGKTSLARHLGKLIGCEGDRFQKINGPEIFNKWVGQSEENIRDIFKPAKEAWRKYGKNAPVYMIVFDEIDAIIPARTGSSGNPVRDTVVNQFLTEMDGLEEFNNLICVGITNRLELLDPASIRAGRFGTHIKIDLPTKEGRVKIFDIHTKKLKEINRLDNINFTKLAELTDKFSGADIESVVQLASSYSIERLEECEEVTDELLNTVGKVTQKDFMKAIDELKQVVGKKKDGHSQMYI